MTESMKIAEYLALFSRKKKPHKYRAQARVVDGIRFASRREAKRYGELKISQRGGWISDLELQPKFKLGTDDAPVLIKSERYPNGRRAVYLADFRYQLPGGVIVIEDVKGIDNPLSRLKRAVVEAQYSIEIVLI